jgi:hypothetical protein
LADDLAELRRAGEVLIAIGGQGFPLNIGEAEVIEPATIEDRNDNPASPVLRELTLEQKIRRQLIDSAPHLLCSDEKRPLRRGRCRHVCHSPVATVIDAVVAIVTVSAHIGAVRVRKRRISGELAVNFRMTS